MMSTPMQSPSASARTEAKGSTPFLHSSGRRTAHSCQWLQFSLAISRSNSNASSSMRSRSASVTSLSNIRSRKGLSLDRNNNERLDRQPRLVHNTSKHVNEGFFGASENIRSVESRNDVEKRYEVGSVIGQGNFSKVYFALRRKDDKKCALKEIEKQSLRGKWFFVENEVEVLQMCGHRNICTLLDAFKSQQKYFLVFEYATDGDLFEAIRIRGKLEEPEAAHVVAQTASALAYLHARKIVHRDVKAENILLGQDWHVKLCDFGLACTILGPLMRVCGTPTYCAPEILKENGYGTPVDVWSLGVLLHIMLIGYAPFRSGDKGRLFRLIAKGKLYFDLPEWKGIGTWAKDLVGRMVSVDVDRRPKAQDISLHPWVSSQLAKLQ